MLWSSTKSINPPERREKGENSSQMRVHARDGCVLDFFRERLQPSFRLPFMRVCAPDCRVRVACEVVENQERSLGNGHLPYNGAVTSSDGSREWKDSVSRRSTDVNLRTHAIQTVTRIGGLTLAGHSEQADT